MSERIDLDCGIAFNRISAWLDDELELPHKGDSWLFLEGSDSCRIHVKPLESRTFATLELERTQLTAQGDERAIDSFRKAFTLRFMSAGG